MLNEEEGLTFSSACIPGAQVISFHLHSNYLG